MSREKKRALSRLTKTKKEGVPMRRTYASALALLTSLLLSFAALAQRSDGQLRPARPDAMGNRHYIVNLDLDSVERQDATDVALPRAPMDPLNSIDFRGWHKPKVRKLVSLMELEYGIAATSMTSHALPSFAAYIPESVLETIRRDPRVERVILVYEGVTFSQTPPWANQPVGGETIPYGKIAIGTNDGLSTGNTVYMIDAGPPIPHADIENVEVAPINQPLNTFLYHAYAVAGVLSARANNIMVRGVNPSATVVSVSSANANGEVTDVTLRDALDWVLGDAEWKGIHAVANISINSPMFVNGHTGQVANFMRRVSNRVLIVQSAGNFLVDACGVAYGPASPRGGCPADS